MFNPLYVLCVLLLSINGITYCLKSTPNDRFWTNFSWKKLRIVRNLLRSRRKSIFSFFVLLDISELVFNCSLTSNKPTHCVLDSDVARPTIFKNTFGYNWYSKCTKTYKPNSQFCLLKKIIKKYSVHISIKKKK